MVSVFYLVIFFVHQVTVEPMPARHEATWWHKPEITPEEYLQLKEQYDASVHSKYKEGRSKNQATKRKK